MSHRTPLRGLRDSMHDSSDWRLSLEFLVPGSLPPPVVESCSVTFPPGFSLYQVSQMLEHGGHHHCRVHGIHVALYSPAGPSEAVTAPPDFGSPVAAEATMDADDSNSDHGTGNPLRNGSVLDLARSVSTHRLTSNEVHAIDHLALQIHQRLESSRSVPHHSDEYARGSWLMTRAYIARALEDTIANPPVRDGAGSSDPPGSVDLDPGLN